MKKRTLLYALAILFTFSGLYGIGQMAADGPLGTIGCLLIAAGFFYWARKTDANQVIRRRPNTKAFPSLRATPQSIWKQRGCRLKVIESSNLARSESGTESLLPYTAS